MQNGKQLYLVFYVNINSGEYIVYPMSICLCRAVSVFNATIVFWLIYISYAVVSILYVIFCLSRRQKIAYQAFSHHQMGKLHTHDFACIHSFIVFVVLCKG